jgi:chemotaxis protein histidine kinase CheA
LIVLRAGARPFGLVVDRAKDTEEIVEKPLGRHF